MSRTLPTRFVVLAFSCVATFALSAAHADITIEQRMAVEGAGAMSMANMTGTTVTSISGERSRTQTDMKMQSKMMNMFARGAGDSTEIVRLDQDKVYRLNNKKKQYTETSFADMRAQMEKVMAQARQAQEKQPAPTGMDESECEWSEPKVDVKKTGAKVKIAGYDAEQTTITASQSCKDRKTGAICDVSLGLDEWLAPGFDGGGQEAMKFYQAYAKKMGFDAGGSRTATERAQAMFGRYEGMWKQVADKMKNAKGYPVRTSFAMSFGGPQCTSAQEAQQAQATLPPPSAPGHMGEAVASAAGQAAGEAAAGKAGQSALGGYAGQIGGKIAGSLFKKKKQQQEAETAAAQPAPAAATVAATNGMITPLRVTSELVAVKTDPVDAADFEIPTGFRKVESND